MANPDVSRLIDELSNILNQNREKRNAADAMLMGIQQGHAQAQARQAEAAAANGKVAGQGASEAAKLAGQPHPAESGYGSDRQSSPYNMKNSPSPSAKGLSPSTSREGRLKLGQDYAHTQQLLSENPYRMEENAPAYTPNNDPALEEQKRRFTQNLMLSRGQTGGPMGGAGQPAPAGDGLDPSVVNAVSNSGGPIAPMGPPNMQPQAPAPQPGAPAGWSDKDYAMLQALSQRYPGG
jgi:hypothetical protein